MNTGFAGVYWKKSSEQVLPSFSKPLWQIVAKKTPPPLLVGALPSTRANLLTTRLL